MLDSLTHWTDALRTGIRRHALRKQLFDVASKLSDEPESRCMYQRLLDEHLQLSSAAGKVPQASRKAEQGPGRKS